MQDCYPLGNEPPPRYESPSPTASSPSGSDLEARYLPRMDMLLAARRSERDAMRLAKREQRRKEAFMRENPRGEEAPQPAGRDQSMEDAPRAGERRPEGETKPSSPPTRCFFFTQSGASLQDVEKRIRGMSGAYPRSPPREEEDREPGVGETARETAATVGNASGEGTPRSKRPRPPRPHGTVPGNPRPRRPPPPSGKKKTPPQPSPCYQDLLALRNKELDLLDARVKEEREALLDRWEERLVQAARVTQPFERYQEAIANRKRDLAALNERRERAREAVEDEWEERLDRAARRWKGGMQPTVEDVDEEGDAVVERKTAGATRGVRYPPLNPELFSPSATAKKRKAELQPTVEEVEDEGDPYVESKQAVPPRRPAHPPLDPNLSTRRRSPSPVRPRNAGPVDVASLLDRRSLWRDYFMALDRESEERAKEALRRAGMMETQTGRANRGGTDVECRRVVVVEPKRTGTKHPRPDPDFDDWFKYFEDVYDSDTMEYQHRLEEAMRYGIPISPPAIASERMRQRKLSSPVAKRRRRNAPERRPFPCFSIENVLKPLHAVSQVSGGRWSLEEELRRAMKDRKVKATVVKTTFTHKPKVAETTFKPAVVDTTSTVKPHTRKRPDSNSEKTKTATPPKPWFVEPQPTSTPAPLTAQNLSHLQTTQESNPPLVKSRRRPSFDSLYNVSTGSSRRAEKQGTLRNPGASAGAAREPWLDEVDAEEQEAIMASLQEPTQKSLAKAKRGMVAEFEQMKAKAKAQIDRDAREQEAIMAAFRSFLASRNVPAQEATGDRALDEAIAEAQAGFLARYVEDRKKKRAKHARCPVERRDLAWELREEEKDAIMLRLCLCQARGRVIERFRNGGAWATVAQPAVSGPGPVRPVEEAGEEDEEVQRAIYESYGAGMGGK